MTDRFPATGSSVLLALTVVGGLLGGLLGWLLARNLFTGINWLWLVPVLPLTTVLASGFALLVTHRAAPRVSSPTDPPPWDQHRHRRPDSLSGTDRDRWPDRGPTAAPPDRRDPHRRAEPLPVPPDAQLSAAQPPARRQAGPPPPRPPAKVVHQLAAPDPAPPDPGAGRAWWNESSRTHRAAPADPPSTPARPLAAYDPEHALIAQCPNCGGMRLDVEGDDSDSWFGFRCRRCSYEWRWQVGTPPPPVVVRAVPPPGGRSTAQPAELPGVDRPGHDSETTGERDR